MLAKLTPLYINIIGALVALIVTALLFFIIIRPKQQTLQETSAAADSLRTSNHGTPEEAAKHKKDKANEEIKKTNTLAQWQVVSGEYMPELPFSNDIIASYAAFQRLPSYWGHRLTDWYDMQRNEGVKRPPDTQFQIPAFPADPNYISTIKHITLPSEGGSWPVTVECKTFDEAMAHLRRFNIANIKGQRLKMGTPVVNNVQLSGPSPHLMVSYSLSLYMISSQTAPPENAKLGGESGAGLGGLGGKAGGAPGIGGAAGRRGGRGGIPGGPGGAPGGGGPGSRRGGPTE